MIKKTYTWLDGDSATVQCEKEYQKTENQNYQYYSVAFLENEKRVGGCFLWDFPACCGVAISTNLYVKKELRGTQYTDKFRELTFELAKELGFSLLIATFETENIPQKKSSKNLGWQHIYNFINRRTTHPLTLMVKDL